MKKKIDWFGMLMLVLFIVLLASPEARELVSFDDKYLGEVVFGVASIIAVTGLFITNRRCIKFANKMRSENLYLSCEILKLKRLSGDKDEK